MENVLELCLADRRQYEPKNVSSAWITLPATATDLYMLEQQLKTPNNSLDVFICDSHSPLSCLHREIVTTGEIDELNYLAALLEKADEHQIKKLEAVCDSENDFESITKYIDFMFNTEYFTLIPDIRSHEALGRYYLYETALCDMPEEWKSGIRLDTFGKHIKSQEGGSFTREGYLIATGEPWKTSYHGKEDIPEEYCLTSADPLKKNYLRNAELSMEQGYDLLDGRLNNIADIQPKEPTDKKASIHQKLEQNLQEVSETIPNIKKSKASHFEL